MAKSDVTLTRERWDVVFRAISRSPAAQDVETQYRQHKLWETLRDGIEGETGLVTIPLWGWQRHMIDKALANPNRNEPWLVQGLSIVWEIREAFGWQRPSDEDYDDEEGE